MFRSVADQMRQKWTLIFLAALAGLFTVVFATRAYWLETLATSLVVSTPPQKSDVTLIENYEPSYLLFEKAVDLQRAGYTSRVLIPVQANGPSGQPNLVSLRIAEVLCQLARVQNPEMMAVEHSEPVTIGVARQVARKLQAEKVQSVIVITPGFRSRRTYLIYQSVLSPLGIRLSCVPVFQGSSPDNWTNTWHGIQAVVEQWLKLQYYRFAVL